ncbi:hypothetical protein J1N35_014121 [Gossypium stocksii]|uniref:Uncharacterized protein n=1 Tax=Gossypium stocksii TaxID=47602 RepID=A0A9D3VU60_9ROSI|nr:hypothetical protein J1N35_014121 [Gossypium stocksii]
MKDVRETLEVVERCTTELDLMEEQFKEFVLESLGSNVEAMRGMLNSTTDKLIVREIVSRP